MAQPLYDMDQLLSFLDRVGKIPVPFLLGVMPLQSSRHAEFLHNELPGVTIPDNLRERMRDAGENGIQEGIRQSQEFLADAQAYCDGTYLMPSFGRYEMVAELVKALDRERWGASQQVAEIVEACRGCCPARCACRVRSVHDGRASGSPVCVGRDAVDDALRLDEAEAGADPGIWRPLHSKAIVPWPACPLAPKIEMRLPRNRPTGSSST